MRRLAHIEGLRAVAAVTVVATHIALISGFTSANRLGPLTARLNVGVALFFVLSAYLLYRPWVEARLNGSRDPDVRRYAVRRFLRIFPAYLVALVVLGLLLPDEAPGVFGGDWWAYFGLLQVYFERTDVGGLGVTWSLATELAFYITLPLLAWAAARMLAGRPRAAQIRLELILLGGLGRGRLRHPPRRRPRGLDADLPEHARRHVALVRGRPRPRGDPRRLEREPAR